MELAAKGQPPSYQVSAQSCAKRPQYAAFERDMSSKRSIRRRSLEVLAGWSTAGGRIGAAGGGLPHGPRRSICRNACARSA